MSRRPGSGGKKPRRLGTLIGATLVTFVLASVAYGAMSSITPNSGTVAPGESVTATFTVTPPLGLASCVAASVSPNPLQFSVVFDGVGLGATNCTLLGEAEVEMTVTASSNATPGGYTVTITEVALLGGRLLTSQEWPLTVQALETTTTTTAPLATTTTRPATTTTAPPATTTTRPATTTTQPANDAGSSAPTTTVTTTSTTTGGTSPTTTTADAPPPTVGNTDITDPSNPSSPEDDDEVLAVGPSARPPYDRYAFGTETLSPQFSWQTELSEELRYQLSGPLFAGLADAARPPLGIADMLLRSLISSVRALLVPVLIASFVGLCMAWRLRRKVGDDELALQRQQMV